MTRISMLLGLVALAACTSGTGVTDDPVGTGTDTGVEQNCDANPISQEATTPNPGAIDVYYRLPRLEVVTLLADPSGVVTLTDPTGTEITGTQSIDEKTLTFFPDSFLTPETTYTVSFTRDCGTITWDWTTNDVGNPLDEKVIGKVYSIDLEGGNWVEPPGIGTALSSVAAGIEILVSPTDATKQVSFIGGLGLGDGTQNLCTDTFPLDGASFQDPYFELEAKVLPFSVTGVDVDINDLFLGGAFAPDGSSLSGMVLEGTIDTRPLVGPLNLEGDDAVCNLALKLADVRCEACEDGTGQYCLSLRVESLNAPEVPGGTLVPRTAQQIADDPKCP